MTSPLIIRPDTHLLLSPRLFGTVGYYALLASCGSVTIDCAMRFDKRRKETHRYEIAHTRGVMTLTVPISKPESSSRALWNDISVSTHGEWWNIQLTALESAYGRTPWFEFYIDTLLPLFRRRLPDDTETITSLDCQADTIVRKLMGIDTEVIYRSSLSDPLPTETIDLRNAPPPSAASVSYWQVRQQQFGFLPDLSILDLLFNMGPEAPLILRAISERSQSSELL